MIKIAKFLLIAGILVLALVGCGGTTAVSAVVTAAVSEMADGRMLDADYEDALSVQDQLALGMLHLDDTDLEVNAALAVELLPLWQTLQSISAGGTAATAQSEVLVRQIQAMMSDEQITAIAAMALTSENLDAMTTGGSSGLQEGDLLSAAVRLLEERIG